MEISPDAIRFTIISPIIFRPCPTLMQLYVSVGALKNVKSRIYKTVILPVVL
jgi:hypothetical protein